MEREVGEVIQPIHSRIYLETACYYWGGLVELLGMGEIAFGIRVVVSL
jgi:hypothetical protein